ncbi:N-formylglutamate amidohydrolase [Falsigemmobacter faecalis]|uniref:N-formylglutamate amidohydrolase n=1 Tax=Falsigemmobacter faecalis TaxID=2488730 RepID=A0A3P3DVF4_9RHOB|nr:N-formylglutamate amidohydrolase [Falsigemmobacter faecalis]RRH77964.1 N-formylglutamate amidohydrolase [Falsigemmobacter faecalis]
MTRAAFDLYEPEKPRCGLVLSSAHSGRDYPAEFIAQSPLSARALRSSEDAFVDLLFQDAPRLGAPLLTARAPRAYVDLNRGPTELDPALIEGVKKSGLNPRLSSGLGVIPRVVGGGRVIHPGRISREEADQRLARHWHPWHRKLAEVIAAQRDRFGQVLLLDCHSMPHDAVSHLRICEGEPPEIVLGDRHGAACAPALMSKVEGAFRTAGFRTSRNMPFAGAHITQTWGRPQTRSHAIQIEIDRSLYMEEATLTPRPEFDRIRARLAMAVGTVVQILRQGDTPRALAAE